MKEPDWSSDHRAGMKRARRPDHDFRPLVAVDSRDQEWLLDMLIEARQILAGPFGRDWIERYENGPYVPKAVEVTDG
jgi:hypothetical protein